MDTRTRKSFTCARSLHDLHGSVGDRRGVVARRRGRSRRRGWVRCHRRRSEDEHEEARGEVAGHLHGVRDRQLNKEGARSPACCCEPRSDSTMRCNNFVIFPYLVTRPILPLLPLPPWPGRRHTSIV